MSNPPVRRLPVALTASRWLRLELDHCARAAGTAFELADTVPAARRLARYSAILVVGPDKGRLIRRPLTGRRRVVIAASIDPDPQPTFAWSTRVGALYVVILPAGRGWLIDKLMADRPQ